MRVRLYSTPFCPYCRMAKEFLEQHDVEFEEVDVQGDREAAVEMIRKSGQTGVPVIEVDGEVIVGFDAKRLAEALGL